MNLNHLKYFSVLADMEHYTKAAKYLGISQPSLSHAISNLEEELGTSLFEKQGRNVVLTKSGTIFLQYVQQSVAILEAGIDSVRESAMLSGGKLSIGYIHTQGTEFIPKLIKGFLRASTDKRINFSFHNDVTSNLIRGLKDGKYDIIFCSKIDAESQIVFSPVSREELVLIVPKHHPLAEKEEVSIEEIGGWPQVSYPASSGLYYPIHTIFQEARISPNILFEIEEDGALAGMVAEGFGIAIVPNVSAIHRDGIKILTIKNLSYERYIYMGVIPPVRSKLLSALISYIEENYEKNE